MQNNQTGRYSISELDNYSSEGGTGKYFSLKEDKDTARARFMANTIEDIPFYVVHEVEVNGKRTSVKCNRNYGDPIDNCPLCKAGIKNQIKFIIPMYMEDEGVVKFWERGKTFASKISSLASRFNPLVNTLFEIERNGAKGNTSTTYETFAINTSQGESILNQLPEIPEVMGTIIKDKTNEEMENFLNTGSFNTPEHRVANNNTTQYTQQRESWQAPNQNQYQQPTRRYTAANNTNTF